MKSVRVRLGQLSHPRKMAGYSGTGVRGGGLIGGARRRRLVIDIGGSS
jgi:hypothetical protein